MTLSPLDAKKAELARRRKAQAEALRFAFDGENLDAKPTPAQDAVLRDAETLVHWIVSSNRSGKSQTGSRIMAWWFLENHPHMTRPTQDDPARGMYAWRGTLQLLLIGANLAQMESELWNKKLKPLLPAGSYKVVRTGGTIQKVVNRVNGNELIFMSHHDAINARVKVQAFTAHVVWLDEMPDHAGLVTELMMRVLTTGGRLYGTFTPLLQNADIYRLVTAERPRIRRHQFLMLENPKFAGRVADVLADVRAMCTSEAEFRCRAYGEWWAGETRVFTYDPKVNRRNPAEYDPAAWRHVAVVDPSASGLTGLSAWAEDPTTGEWYCVLAERLKGDAAFTLFDDVESRLHGMNLVARWTDCNPAGFYKEAARRGQAASGGMPWRPFTDKNDRKLATIDKLNTGFLNRRVWLTDAAAGLEEDLVKCEWASKNDGKIVNATKYHLADTARYFWDVVPAFTPAAQTPPKDSIRHQWHSRLAKAAKAKAEKAKIFQRRSLWTRQSKRYS